MRVDWYVCDENGTPQFPVDGKGGTITFDGFARIGRVCRGVEFLPEDWAKIKPFRDWLQPVVTFQDVTLPMGLFTVAGAPLTYLTAEVQNPISPYLVDGGFYLTQPSAQSLSVRSASRLSDALRSLAREAGVKNIAVDACGERCGRPMSQGPGSSIAEFMAGVAKLAGFAPPWFDRFGVLRLQGLDALTEPPVAVFDASNIIRASRVKEENYYDAPNTFMVVGTDATGTAIVAKASIPANLPHSVENRNGREVIEVLTEQGLASVAQAQRIANAAATAVAEDFEQLTFSSAPTLAIDGFSVVEVNGVAYRSVGWTLPLSPGGVMTHRVHRTDKAVA